MYNLSLITGVHIEKVLIIEKIENFAPRKYVFQNF